MISVEFSIIRAKVLFLKKDVIFVSAPQVRRTLFKNDIEGMKNPLQWIDTSFQEIDFCIAYTQLGIFIKTRYFYSFFFFFFNIVFCVAALPRFGFYRI